MSINQPIIISGAGPVGLTAATILSQNGVPVIVYEKGEGPSKEWRASTFHASTLELLEETGLTDELLKRGIIADKVQYRDRQNGLFAEFDFSLIKDETKYPFRLQCPQSTYVQVAYEKLQKSSNVEVYFNSEIIDIVQDEDGVNVTVEQPDGIHKVRTPFLLGADGARSTVRKESGMRFEGYTLEEKFLLVGTSQSFTQFISDIEYVNYISDPDQFLFMLHVPGAWRLLYPVPSNVDDHTALDSNKIQKQLQTVFNTDIHFPIIETALYRVHQRIADTMHKNRIVLLGDAGHINSPMGGLGLNSGVHDAVDLSQRLIKILNNKNSIDYNKEFKVYSDLRRDIANKYIKKITEKNTRILKEKDPTFRLEMQKNMAEEAKDKDRARKWLLDSSLITSIREQGFQHSIKN
jgi:3-(3-hydroxy-phenyl)propionate hydroxylase